MGLLWEIHGRLLEGPASDATAPIAMLLYDTVCTCESIQLLGCRQHSSDTRILARVALERLINVCYICTDPAGIGRRARLHALQKTLRQMSRKIETKGVTIQFCTDAAVDPAQQEDLDTATGEFTSKRGRELNWTSSSVRERIEAIEAKYGSDVAAFILGAYVGIYDEASELAHGTFYGTMSGLGATGIRHEKPSADAIARLRRTQIAFVLNMLTFCMSSAIVILNKEFQIADIAARRDEVTKRMRAQMKKDREARTDQSERNSAGAAPAPGGVTAEIRLKETP
jgi:hypothetical protein